MVLGSANFVAGRDDFKG